MAVLLGAATLSVVGARVLQHAPDPEDGLDSGTVVVLPLQVDASPADHDWLSLGVAELIRAQLQQNPGVRVVSRQRVAEALARAGQPPGALADEPALRVARELRAARLVSGAVRVRQGRFDLDLRLTDLALGRTSLRPHAQGRHPEEMLDAVQAVSAELAGALRANGSAVAWQPTRLATRSAAASRLYAEALVEFARGGRPGAEEAERRLDRAVALDPAFAQAYLKKAEIQHWRRRWGYGTPDPIPTIRKAARLAEGLSYRDRLMVESLEALLAHDDPAGALRNLELLLRFHPAYAQEAGVPSLASEAFLRLGRWDELALVAEAQLDSPSLPDDERARLDMLLSDAYAQRGDAAGALRHARRALDLWPSRIGPGFLQRRIWVAHHEVDAGEPARGLSELRAAAQAPEADAANLTDAAWGVYSAAEPNEAERLAERALALDGSYGNAHHLLGWLRLKRGDLEGGARSLEAAFQSTPPGYGSTHHGQVQGDIAALYYAGVARLKLRDPGGRAHLERLSRLCGELLSAGGPANAAARWQAANFLARAAARLGRPAPEPPPLEGDDHTYLLQSARLYAVRGEAARALDALARARLMRSARQHARDDPDFESLRADPRFRQLTLLDAAIPGPRAAGRADHAQAER